MHPTVGPSLQLLANLYATSIKHTSSTLTLNLLQPKWKSFKINEMEEIFQLFFFGKFISSKEIIGSHDSNGDEE